MIGSLRVNLKLFFTSLTLKGIIYCCKELNFGCVRICGSPSVFIIHFLSKILLKVLKTVDSLAISSMMYCGKFN